MLDQNYMIIIETRNIYHIIYFWLNAVRRVNMTQDGDKVHWGNKLIVGSRLFDCWDECIKTSKYMEKREAINKFNKTGNSHKKRGISIMPMKFSVSFGVKFLHQVELYI